MNKNGKLRLEEYNLQASIHTVSMKSSTKPVISPDMRNAVDMAYYDKGFYFTKINPNKLGEGDILAYSEFVAIMTELFNELQMSDATFWRTDIRFDSYLPNFKQFYKLNLLLLSLLALELNDQHRQAVGHIYTQTKEFSDITTGNTVWQATYYDKFRQMNDTGDVMARLELRCLRNQRKDGFVPLAVRDKWIEKLDSLLAHYDSLQIQSNEKLLHAYQRHCAYCSKRGKLKSDLLTEFLSDYRTGMTVFTHRQLREFFMLCGVSEKQAKERAVYIQKKTYIEFFSKEDLKRYIAKLKDSMTLFFTC